MDDQQNAQSKEERRKVPRLNILVTYVLIGEDQKREASITKNISADGLCIISDRELKNDSFVSLEIDLFDEQPALKIKGKIIWNNEIGFGIESEKKDYEVGIEFIEIDDSSRRRISEYVLTHHPQRD